MTSSRRLPRGLGLRLIGPAIVVAAIWWSGPAKVWAILTGADPRFVAAAISLALVLTIVKGVRWKRLLNEERIAIGLRDSVSMYATGMMMAAVTPGHMGDFVKVWPLVRRGHSTGKAIALNVVDRLLDVAFLLLAGYLSMLYFSRLFESQLRKVYLGAAIAAVVVVATVAFRKHVVSGLVLRLVPSRYRDTVRQALRELVETLRGKGLRVGVELTLLTAVFWIVQFLAAWLCARALGLELSFVYLSACVAIVTLASFAPITVAGAGTRDAIFVVLLGQIGFGRAEAVALSSLVLAVFVANIVVFYLVSTTFAERTPAPTG